MSPRLYYHLKPYIPWRIRIALRRWRAKRLRASSGAAWPILDVAGKPPEGWPGWPGGKRFAFVLTHDVEGEEGINRCIRLGELDKRFGFRSAFNFVPEGDYRVPEQLRQELASEGFEIGVHDLEHDGFLYRSHKSFKGKAERINGYLKAWNAQGFRSGFMLHNLKWVHDLNILYDASTFDTDPFEPQPDGVSTIFPFWVSGPNGRGFVELPYTLIQDFNLFVVLQEKTIDVWKRKIDWIAAHGGMALLIVHPDYVDFSNSGSDRSEFPASLYEELLAYVSSKYAGDYWTALPREVAAHVAQYKPVCATSAESTRGSYFSELLQGVARE